MNRLLSILVLILLLSTACKKKQNIPEHIIQPDECSEILKDIMLAEANHKVSVRNNLHIDNFLDSSYHHIYAQYGVTQSEVDSSLRFYTRHPDIFRTITEDALDKLHQMEQTEKPDRD